MACRPAAALILLLTLFAVAHGRRIEAEHATDVSSPIIAVPTDVLPSSDAISTEVVPAGQESGLLQLPSDHSVVVVYHQDAGAEGLGRQDEAAAVMPFAEPDPDRAQPAGTIDAEELTKEPSTDGHETEDEDEEEEKATKRLHHEDGDDSDSDSDDEEEDDFEEKAKRWVKALKRRWSGHRRHHHHHHHHGHRHHAEGEAAKQQADGKQEESGVMTWIKGLMNRF